MAKLKHGRLQLRPCVGATHQKVWVLVAALGLACSDTAGPGDCDPTAPGPSIAQARLDSVPPRPTEPRTVDDEWAAIARQVPGGWGGLFLENQIPTIYLVDPSKREEAIEALIALGIGGGEFFDLREARVRQGRWDFAQLYDWRWYLDARLGAVGLTSRDIDELQNRLVYGVKDDAVRTSWTARIDSLNIPCELVIVEVRPGVVVAASPKRAV